MQNNSAFVISQTTGSSLVVDNCTIQGNSGGFLQQEGGLAEISGSTFLNNLGLTNEGCFQALGNSVLKISNSLLFNCSSLTYAGTMRAQVCFALFYFSIFTFRFCFVPNVFLDSAL